MSVLSAAAGAYVHLFTDLLRGGGLIMGLVSLGLAIGLHMTPDNGKNRGQRLAMLLGKSRMFPTSDNYRIVTEFGPLPWQARQTVSALCQLQPAT